MKTCLKLYHHSLFPGPSAEEKGKNDGKSGEKKGNKSDGKKGKKGDKGKEGEEGQRKINVELT